MTPHLWFVHGYLRQYLNRKQVHFVFFLSNQISQGWGWDLSQNLRNCEATGHTENFESLATEA